MPNFSAFLTYSGYMTQLPHSTDLRVLLKRETIFLYKLIQRLPIACRMRLESCNNLSTHRGSEYYPVQLSLYPYKYDIAVKAAGSIDSIHQPPDCVHGAGKKEPCRQ